MYLPAIVVLSVYFKKRLSLAIGIAVCGSGVGTFAFAPLLNALLSEYSWRGTVLTEAGILLNGIICGMIFRPLKVTKTPDEVSEDEKCTDVIGTGQQIRLVRSASNPELSTTFASSARDAVVHFNKSQTSTSLLRSSTQQAGATARKDVLHSKSLNQIPQYFAERDEFIRSTASLEAQSEPQNRHEYRM